MIEGRVRRNKMGPILWLVVLLVILVGLGVWLVVTKINEENKAGLDVEEDVVVDDMDAVIKVEPDASSGTGASGSGEN
ncbi:hypothetical protein IJJ53_00095 [Candidatus Saccharibacteria bacterium]|nr:hypothetical protein [Candidatus Saccharibacteria bacterium]